MIGVTVNYIRLEAIVDPIDDAQGVLVAETNYRQAAAIIDLQDAQGWKSISDTPRYRAEVNKVEIVVADVYSLVVDRISLSDDVALSDQVIFQMNKGLFDDAPAIDSIAFEVSKPFSDNAPVDESVIFSMEKPFSDNVTQSDSSTFNMNKAVSDDVEQTDSVLFFMDQGGTGALNGAGLATTPIAANKGRVFSA